jgi:hypothetical protein
MSVTVEVTNRLEEMFNFFNEKLGTSQIMRTPVFTLIPNQGKQNYLGWFWSGGWQTPDGVIREINITADQLERPVADIGETIIHEMAHYANWAEGIEDVRKGSQYHNKHFKKRAEAFGLEVEKWPNKGYALTKLGPEATKLIMDYKAKFLKGDENPFNVKRLFIPKPQKEIKTMIITVDKEIGQAAREKFASAKAFREYVEQALQKVSGTIVKDEPEQDC